MSMVKFSDEIMREQLELFGESFEYPVYCTSAVSKGLFSSGAFTTGYAAISGAYLLIVRYDLAGTFSGKPILERVPLASIIKVKIREIVLLKGYRVEIQTRSENKKIKCRLSISKSKSIDIFTNLLMKKRTIRTKFEHISQNSNSTTCN